MDKERLHSLIGREQPNICQVSVYCGDRELYSDEWNGYAKTDCVHVMSVTKSVVALLIGMAIDKGLIAGTDDRILGYFPDYTVKRGEKTIQEVTVKHLMTMRAPYKCKGDPWSKVCSSDDWTKASLDFLGGRKGITGEFNYQTVCLHILTGLLARVSGMSTADFANEYLFEPLGIAKHRGYTAETAEEHKAFTIGKAPKDNIWFGDPKGVGAAGYGLCLSAEDMAKLGLLCLNRGEMNGRQIVSSGWIDTVSTPTYEAGEEFRNMMYGYLWWIIDKEKNIYAAIGNSGNLIYVDTAARTVVSVTSYFKPTVFDRIDFIEKKILPAVFE